jgi:hypothetical protein
MKSPILLRYAKNVFKRRKREKLGSSSRLEDKGLSSCKESRGLSARKVRIIYPESEIQDFL